MYGEHHILPGLTSDAFDYNVTEFDWTNFKHYDDITRT
jgi:hypothetical protein